MVVNFSLLSLHFVIFWEKTSAEELTIPLPFYTAATTKVLALVDFVSAILGFPVWIAV